MNDTLVVTGKPSEGNIKCKSKLIVSQEATNLRDEDQKFRGKIKS